MLMVSFPVGSSKRKLTDCTGIQSHKHEYEWLSILQYEIDCLYCYPCRYIFLAPGPRNGLHTTTSIQALWIAYTSRKGFWITLSELWRGEADVGSLLKFRSFLWRHTHRHTSNGTLVTARKERNSQCVYVDSYTHQQQSHPLALGRLEFMHRQTQSYPPTLSHTLLFG